MNAIRRTLDRAFADNGFRAVYISFLAILGVALLAVWPSPFAAMMAFGILLGLIGSVVLPSLPSTSLAYKVLSGACMLGNIGVIAAMALLIYSLTLGH
ncbi:MAG: hypothetical protein U0836_13610 [Pirellulales bacterium]